MLLVFFALAIMVFVIYRLMISDGDSSRQQEATGDNGENGGTDQAVAADETADMSDTTDTVDTVDAVESDFQPIEAAVSVDIVSHAEPQIPQKLPVAEDDKPDIIPILAVAATGAALIVSLLIPHRKKRK